ncbi:serine/threonine-protein kinase NIM1 [Sabethes cyaneus]|uniref:serine/threonine-protein kinase NIM1 n=1 Tax=Sabethes cyaneus TaxID=53552 RepID=UPI00237D5270|nr:serine/threonine-protein kinase NIM1 [Sabethes cyaneus]XP_053694909.1 serine/threonine-protein kinase NIM1 [Sabethes cyaneus]
MEPRPNEPARTPVYQRFTTALQNDPRCSQEVALGRRIGLYRFCGDIGRGNFSRVKLAVHQLTKDKVAIKIVDTNRLDAKALRMLSREVTTLESVFHPFVIRLFEVIETFGKIYIIGEWVPGGELYNKIADGGPLEESHAAILFYQILIAVQHLHSLGYVHRDIKAENILMIDDNRIKLADFGFSTQLVNGPWEHLDTFCGSPPYAAPELFSDDHYIGGPVDIWALGILLYFMLLAKMPFRASTIPLLRSAVLKGDFEIPTSISLPCCRVIQRILVHTPSRRPTIDQLLKSQWFETSCASKNSAKKKSAENSDSRNISQNSLKIEPSITHKKLIWSLKQRKEHYTNQPANSKVVRIADEELHTSSSVQCSTRRAGSVLDINFLRPFENSCVVYDNENNTNFYDRTDNLSTKTRKFTISCVERKRITPIGDCDMYNSSFTYIDYRNILQKIAEEEHGKYMTQPTINVNEKQCSLELQTRKIMENLGISSNMIEKSVINSPRSDIIGIYRIIMHRLQKEQSITSLIRECIDPNKKVHNCKSTINGKNIKEISKKSNKSCSKTISCTLL